MKTQILRWHRPGTLSASVTTPSLPHKAGWNWRAAYLSSSAPLLVVKRQQVEVKLMTIKTPVACRAVIEGCTDIAGQFQPGFLSDSGKGLNMHWYRCSISTWLFVWQWQGLHTETGSLLWSGRETGTTTLDFGQPWPAYTGESVKLKTEACCALAFVDFILTKTVCGLGISLCKLWFYNKNIYIWILVIFSCLIFFPLLFFRLFFFFLHVFSVFFFLSFIFIIICFIFSSRVSLDSSSG
jgi:hypothetical protein